MALSGGYTGGRTDLAQLSRWQPTAGSANADTIRDIGRLRARSRDQMRNAPVALGALNTVVSHTVGTGLAYTPAIDGPFLGLTAEQAEAWQADTQRRFNAWALSPDCDLARQLDFYGLQELAFRSHLESGDSFVLTPIVARQGVRQLALQLIEADRVCNPSRQPDTDILVDGIELNPATGEAIAAHVARRHPGAHTLGSNDWTRVAFRGNSTGRRNLLQIFKPLRPGQVRGVPWVAPILEPLKQLGRWSDAELNAAVVSSAMVTFVRMDPEAFQSIYDEDSQEAIIGAASKWSGEMDTGKAINLLPGESIENPAPGRPNPAFDPFWTAMVRQIGMALEMPFEVLVMHFQSSYSAARAALLMAYKSFRGKRDLLAKTMCQPVFDLWLADEVAAGHINAPGFFADPVVRAAWCSAIWTGDGPGSIDPVKEVTAAKMRVELGISTKQAESIAFDGVDWDRKHEQRVKETNAEKRDGIYTLPGGVTQAPATGEDAGNTDGAGPADAPGTPSDTDDAIAKLQSHMQAMQSELANAQDMAELRAQVQAQRQAPAAPVNVSVGVATEQIEAMGQQLALVAENTFAKGMAQIREDIQNMPIVIPAPNVTVEAIMPEQRSEAPVVNITNQVAPAGVTVIDKHPVRAVQKVERDNADEITQTVTTYEFGHAKP
jgi:lambda family phage portal protein